MNVSLSAVVPTYRRDGLLKRCLEALCCQDLGPLRYEIIVVDDAARIETRKTVENLHTGGVSPALRYFAMRDRHGPAAARNRGWRAARGRIVAFTDDDCIPSPQWLREGMMAFRDDIAGVSGRIVVPLSDTPTDFERTTARLEEAEFATANCFYRRAVLERVGGFDERFTAAWREDADLFFTLLERNYRVLFAPEAVVVHPVRSAHWGISIREQSKTFFNALLYKKHPDLYRQRIQRSAPLHYYAAAGSLFLSAAAAALGKGYAAALPMAAWIAATLMFSKKRLSGTSRSVSHIIEMGITSAVIPFLSLFWRFRGALRFRAGFFKSYKNGRR